MSTNRGLLIAAGVSAGILLGVLPLLSRKWVKLPPPTGVATAVPTPEPMVEGGSGPGKKGESDITIYTVAMNEDGSKLVPSTFHTTDPTPEGRAEAAIGAMATGATPPLPPGTHVRSVRFDNGTAIVDLNESFRKNFTGGDQMEALALNAITSTLAQFEGVRKVQILVEGQKIDSLGGAQSLREPLTASRP